MLWLEQLELLLWRKHPPAQAEGSANDSPASDCDAAELEKQARALLASAGARLIARRVRVRWHARLRSSAGRAHYQTALVLLNPRLVQHGNAEIDRTLRHELAHLLAHARARRRRIAPHGPEWRQACTDLGIANEKRCHTLPFPTQRRPRPYLYRCPACAADFPRVRRIRRAVACLSCCRRHSRGRYEERFKLRLVRAEKRL